MAMDQHPPFWVVRRDQDPSPRHPTVWFRMLQKAEI